GQLTSEAVSAGGLDAANRLSRALAEVALPRAILAIEGNAGRREAGCSGKVLFAGGGGLLALVAAAPALPAAQGRAQATEAAGKECDFAKLTASLAVTVVDPRSPLRPAITALTELLESAKGHQRDEDWSGQRERTRHAFGLAVVPGSGNIKRGVVGLRVPV